MTPDWAHAEELDALAEERDEARRELAQAQREVKSLSSSLTHWKNLLTRRTTTLRNRAERAERELGELRSAARVVVSDFERELERLRATDARPYGLTEYGVGGMETLQQFEGDVARVRALLGVEDTNTTGQETQP